VISPQTTPTDGHRLQALRDHLRRRPDDGAAWLALARALFAALTAEASAEELHHALEQAIKSAPEALNTWLLAASVHQRQRGPAAALQWLRYAARQNPQLAAPRVALASLRADAYRQAGQWSEALAAYREVEAFRPGDPWLLNNVGTCLASLERFPEAAGRFEAALRLQPGFPEARLNMALVHACQSKPVEALRGIDGILAEGGLDAATRRAATLLRDILREQERLEPYLQGALAAGDVAGLQHALALSPPNLGQPHGPTVAKLRALAAQCGKFAHRPEDFRCPGDLAAWHDVEAFAQCKLSGGSTAFAAWRAAMASTPAGAEAVESPGKFLHMLSVIRDRAHHDPALLHGPDGEAWLKYWHARLFNDTPKSRPGQYKLVTNVVEGLPTTPPEFVAGTFRLFLSDILPSAPAGVARGLLIYVAINVIHGFGDGNGRLSRFFLAWETESVGLPPLSIPLELRSLAARGINAARLEGELQPLVEVLRLAQAETGRLLSELSASDSRAAP
jgi:tetratricopeptide (TPR) repeat protein